MSNRPIIRRFSQFVASVLAAAAAVLGVSPATAALPPSGAFFTQLGGDIDGGIADTSFELTVTAQEADCTEHTLFVAGASPAPSGDRSFLSAIEDRNPGLACLVTIDDDLVTMADAEAVDVVVISSSVQPSTLGDRLRDAAVPILVAEPFLFDDMSMVHSGDGRELAGRSSIKFVDPTDPLAGGLSGSVRVFETASTINYGTLDSESLLDHQVANTGGTSRRSTIFAYETGDQLVDTGDVARAGRVGFFASYGAALTHDARTLTNAAIDWLVDQPAEITTCGATVTTDVVFTEDLLGCPGPGLIVGADGITIDLNGHRLAAASDSTSNGIDQRNRSGVTIKNGHISDFLYSISLINSHDNVVEDIVVSRTSRLVEMAFSSRNVLRDLHANDADAGIRMTSGSNNTVDDVDIHNSRWGIIIDNSHDNLVTSSRVFGGATASQQGVTVSGDASGNTVRNVEASRYDIHGIAVFDTATNTILDGNNTHDNLIDGIRVDAETTGTMLAANTANDNREWGIRALAAVVDNGGNSAFDNGVGPCQGVACTTEPPPRVLLVAGNPYPSPADRAIVSIIEDAGVLVDIVDDDAVLAALDLSVYDAVFISATVVPSKVGDTFRDTPIPVMVWEGALFDEMALSTVGKSTTPVTNLAIGDPTHDLAADLGAGGHRVYANPHPLSFGSPSTDAEVVAHVQGNRNRAVIFAYDAGDLRIDGTPSPALRVGLFPSADGGADLSRGGEQLVAAAVDWVLAGGPPPNDDFADRFPAVVGSMTGDNVGATMEPDERTFFVGLFVETAGSVWWEWTAPFTGVAQIDTAGSTFDTFLAVSQGDGVDFGSGTVLATNDDGIGSASLVALAVTAGETYQISVYSLGEIDTGTGVGGDIVLNIAEAALAPNDHFADAIDFVGPSMTGSNINTTLEPGEAVPSVIDAEEHGTSAWWTWVADRDGTVSFNTIGSSFDTVLAVWTGDGVDALTEVASNDDCCWSPSSPNRASEVFVDATIGVTYHIAVSGWRGDSGTVVLVGPG